MSPGPYIVYVRLTLSYALRGSGPSQVRTYPIRSDPRVGKETNFIKPRSLTADPTARSQTGSYVDSMVFALSVQSN
jgi:hypothetical protein